MATNDQRIPFFHQMTPATFGGMTLYTLATRLRFGRRQATHEYPFCDSVWVEDLGRQARRIVLSCFLIGDDVIAQLASLITAAESATPSELVHPTLGRVQVALMDCETGDTLENGRIVEVVLTFVQQGQRRYPDNSAANPANTAAVANATATNTATAWSQQGGVALTGPSSNQALVGLGSTFTAQAAAVALNATALLRMSAVLPALAGNLLRQGTGILSDQVVVGFPSTIQGLIGRAAAGRTAVAGANDSLIDTAGTVQQGNATDFSDAVAASCEAVRLAAATPGDGVDALANLAGFDGGDASLTGDALTAYLAAQDLMQRMAAISMVRAAAAYQADTSEDALALRDQVLAVLDQLIDDAGDSGDDTAFQALRTLRATIVAQINAMGSALPALKTVVLYDAVPVHLLAQRLYRDPSRADELIVRTGTRNPVFIAPGTYQVLSQ